MIHHILEQFGIGTAATTVYLASLKLGEATISEVARATHLPRSSVKRQIDLLIEKGFLNFFVQGKHKIIIAEPPEKIRQTLEDKIGNLNKALSALPKNSYHNKYHPRVFFYEGLSEIKKIYRDILAEQRPIDAITSPDDAYKILGSFFDIFIQERLLKKIPMRLLAPTSPQAIKFKESDDKFLRKTRLLGPNVPSHIASYIYGNKVAIISLRDPNASGIVIDDPIVANAQKVLFGLLWDCKCSV